jgi:uncharacterized protein YjbJ (UPF0337 family)
MSKFREKAQGRVKQLVGQMVADDQLVQEGREQAQEAEKEAESSTDDRARASQH